jgi:cell division transport system permease protein
MATTFLRILKYGFQNFWRNGWLSTATILVMVLALLAFQGLIIFNVVNEAAVTSIQDKIDIAVYFKRTTAEDDILKMEKSIKALPEVKIVDYVSSEEALATFKEKHKDDPTINQALQELSQNPLLASLNIKANNPLDYPVIATYLEHQGFSSIVERVTYAQNKTAIDQLNKITDTANRGGLALTIFIAFAASLVTFSTIRLAIYSNREEIGIMRLVGASNIFTKGPYLVSGILYGFFGALVTLLLSAIIINFVSPYLNSQYLDIINLESYFYANIISFLGYLLLFGAFLGTVSSWVAIRRYLKI